MFPSLQEIHQFPFRDDGFMTYDYYNSPYSEERWLRRYGVLESDEPYRLPAQQRLTFVLVHGSWADAHFQDGVAAVLCSQGHTVFTPEYAGHGKDSNKDVTHEMITKSVVDFITDRNLCDFVLVGHSFGGSVIQKVAEQVPDRIKRLIFWDAFVLNDGESVADEMPHQTRQGFEQLLWVAYIQKLCVLLPRQCIAARRGLRLESTHVDTAWSVPPYCW